MEQIPDILTGRRRWLMVRFILNGMAQAGMMIATAWLVKIIFDGFITPANGTAPSLLWRGTGLALAGIGIALLRMTERIDAERMGQHYTHELHTGLFAHMSQLSPRILQQRRREGSCFASSAISRPSSSGSASD